MLLVAALAVTGFGLSGLAQGEDKTAQKAPPKPKGGLNEDLIKQITDAVPDKPAVKPEKPRKLLVFYLCKGYRHASIPIANKAFEIMAAKTGAFEVTLSEDPNVLEPDKLKEFDGVLMNNNTGEFFGPTPKPPPPPKKGEPAPPAGAKAALAATPESAKAAELCKSLCDFVAGGKGIAGIHASTDWKGWDDYGALMGGQFLSHPYAKIVAKNEEPDNPINAAFGGKEFPITDEMYTFKESYTRKDKRVLLSIDTEKSGITRHVRQDKDYWVSWVRPHGKGRVFYCSFGHQTPIFYNKQILQHYLAGIQYALGDLKVDDAPKD
jgi:hypothetical protein